MGLFDSWNVSGITSDTAKDSEPFYDLGYTIKQKSWDVETDSNLPTEYILEIANNFLEMKGNFDAYFDSGVKHQKDNAIKFLVLFASYSMGLDRTGWDWQQVRHFSQGLYGSMNDSPAHFLHYNTPLIEQVISDVNSFVDELVGWQESIEEHGYAEAHYKRGVMYRDEPQNYHKAVIHFKLAAEQGYLEAQYILGTVYEGSGLVFPKDMVRSAFDKASIKVRHQIAENDEEAFKWFKLAAEKGHEEAQYWLGHYYEGDYYEGIEEAVKWYKLAAEQGHVKAQDELGFYYEGDDNIAAIKWYKLAAEQGSGSAAYGLGMMYKEGKGVPKDDEEGNRWLSMPSAIAYVESL